LADDYQRIGQTFRAEDFSGVLFPVVLAGAHVRTYNTTTQTLTLTASAQTLTVPTGYTFADIYCEGSADTAYCRFWHGGATPTSASGVKLKDHEVLQSADPVTFRAINSSGTCILRVEYYKYV
jgi:hypothetical protein